MVTYPPKTETLCLNLAHFPVVRLSHIVGKIFSCVCFPPFHFCLFFWSFSCMFVSYKSTFNKDSLFSAVGDISPHGTQRNRAVIITSVSVSGSIVSKHQVVQLKSKVCQARNPKFRRAGMGFLELENKFPAPHSFALKPP